MVTVMPDLVPFRRFLVLCLVSATAAGCGEKETSLSEGCYIGDAVPPAVKAEVTAAADRFFGRLRDQQLQEIYDGTASLVREQQPAAEFLQAIVRAARGVGIPRDPELHQIHVVKFGPRMAYQPRLSCPAPGQDDPYVLILNEHPEQASLVQTASVGNERYFFSSLWHREEGEWRLVTFGVKPATLYGKDWREYEREAVVQQEKEHVRNTALLYNIAIDLAVPAPWVKPPAIEALQRGQRRLQVEYLPSGGDVMDVWGAAPDTFVVNRVAYVARSDGLGLIVHYLSQGDVADSTFQDRRARKLVDFIAESSPEYFEIFKSVSVQAFDREDREKTWFGSYPLRRKEP